VQPLSLDAFGEPLHRFDAFTASVCNLNPTSRGTVRIRSPRPEDAPAIAANYLSTPADRRWRRVAAADAAHRRAAGAGAYQPREVKPGVQFQTDAELARLAGDIGTTIFHPVGTCRWGRRRSDGGGRPAAAPARRGRPAHRRRQRDAHHHQRQHQCADADDRRARADWIIADAATAA
jgi:choline dehydrogenase-like flavoprotein